MQFTSDNQSGASDKVLEEVSRCFSQSGGAYGEDEETAQATRRLQAFFEGDCEVIFVPTGTASNALALSCLVDPWGAMLCHHQAHTWTAESTAPEVFSGGGRILPMSPERPKIVADDLEQFISRNATSSKHSITLQALSIAQASELGHVYSLAEIEGICAVAKAAGLHVHMDGARFFNALAALDCSPREMTRDLGVDVLSLGGTKNGAIAAEAIVFFNVDLARNAKRATKRFGHLLSKSRFLGCQFNALLKNEHWRDLACAANSKAAEVARVIETVEGARLPWPVQSNEVFAVMPKACVEHMEASGVHFLRRSDTILLPHGLKSKSESAVRFVASFSTSDEEIKNLGSVLKEWR